MMLAATEKCWCVAEVPSCSILYGGGVDLLHVEFSVLNGSSEIEASVILELGIFILFKTILVVVCLTC